MIISSKDHAYDRLCITNNTRAIIKDYGVVWTRLSIPFSQALIAYFVK